MKNERGAEEEGKDHEAHMYGQVAEASEARIDDKMVWDLDPQKRKNILYFKRRFGPKRWGFHCFS